MQSRDLARLLVKFAGLIILVYAVSDLPIGLGRALAGSKGLSTVDVIAMTIAPSVISIVTGLLMYWQAGRLVDRALLPDSALAGVADLRGLEEIATAVLGLYLICWGLGEAVYYGAKADIWIRFTTGLGRAEPIQSSDFAGLCASAVRTLLGFALFFLSRGIGALRRRFLSLRGLSEGESQVAPE